MWSLCLVSDSVIEDVRPVGHCDPPLLLPGWGPGSVSVIFPPVFFSGSLFLPSLYLSRSYQCCCSFFFFWTLIAISLIFFSYGLFLQISGMGEI